MTNQSLIEFPLDIHAKFRLYELRQVTLSVFTADDLRRLFYWQNDLNPDDHFYETGI